MRRIKWIKFVQGSVLPRGISEWMNEEPWMRGQQTCPLTIHFNMNTKLGRQHTKAPLEAALSPFMSFLYPPNPWCEWCDEWRLFRPYSRRLESLTICRYHYKGNTFFSDRRSLTRRRFARLFFFVSLFLSNKLVLWRKTLLSSCLCFKDKLNMWKKLWKEYMCPIRVLGCWK